MHKNIKESAHIEKQMDISKIKKGKKVDDVISTFEGHGWKFDLTYMNLCCGPNLYYKH